ncbi:ribonuclease HI [Marinospirillum perlucidum]|uniref:ribonuclease HI n=1 Tax=Marinospirillum perlucidum TaxID=1982602 RepID=UPI000DF11C19|nr:ribonuclease HI [Marinospirillum perlucidum]
MKSDISIYTDGSCLNNGSEFAPGGWAAVLENDCKQLRISGRECPTTNQRMELMAIIKGLKAVRSSSKVINVYTDSAYARNGCITWRHNWKKNGWIKSDKKPVENLDLWKQLDELLEQYEVTFYKVKGHSGHPQNELADSMAGAAARGQVFKSYRQVGDYQFDWREAV